MNIDPLELTKDVLRETAPKELILAENFDRKQRSFGSTAKGPLGFGLAGTAALLLPVVYIFFDGFVSELKQQLQKLGGKAADEVMSRIVKIFLHEGATSTLEDNTAIELIRCFLIEHGAEQQKAVGAATAIAKVLDGQKIALKGDANDS